MPSSPTPLETLTPRMESMPSFPTSQVLEMLPSDMNLSDLLLDPPSKQLLVTKLSGVILHDMRILHSDLGHLLLIPHDTRMLLSVAERLVEIRADNLI